ncbi:MAG: ABC transporter permease [Bryobacterales bacterium]|nr:ABC transporter permease [Bryobacterales bacterium]
MRVRSAAAAALLILLLVTAIGADWISPLPYKQQNREEARQSPGPAHWLGSDDLGRDLWSRLLYGTRVSLLLAGAAALLATLIAAAVGVTAAYCGGYADRLLMSLTDLFLSIPWLFLLLTVRALLPLNTPPWESVAITFLLLGLLGWAGAARLVRASALARLASPFALQAHAAGISPLRLLALHLLPNLTPVLEAQFLLALPAFLLGEANLGMLGLGVSEPLPSWGNLLAELTSPGAVAEAPWLIAPAVVVLLSLLAMHELFERSRRTA